MSLEKELNLAIKTAKEAGNYLRSVYRASSPEILIDKDKDIKLKEDLKSEEIILYYLSKSKYTIISEHTSKIFDSEFMWIVDPLDGSLNFSRGISNCAVSIALWKGLEPLLGIIYDFNRDEVYYGSINKGAYLNEKKISVSSIKNKNNAIICTGFPSRLDYSTENLLEFVKKVQDFKKVRILGSASLSLAYVASGKAEVYYEKGIMLWDVAAGLVLVRSAGGNFKITKIGENQFDVWASNGKINND
ncbi:MAG: inositol phosphatase [Candidatus Parcubacteria bacterium]|nr:MAG: inositol phosphatase [Candidatus Pacearchaeota archaeon]GIW65365.1 MAG: inositol phosphatase [Candidatus Parcubacteria bacterium]